MKPAKNLLLLGATGNTGKWVAHELIKNNQLKLYLGGRNYKKLEKFRDELGHNHVKVRTIDIKDRNTYSIALVDIDLVINCASYLKESHNLMKYLVDHHIHYIDSNLSFPDKHEFLSTISERINQNKLSFITDCGYHPGIPVAMIRYLSEKYFSLDDANCYAVMKMDWKSLQFADETGKELIEEFRHYCPLYYENGKWKRWKFTRTMNYDFGKPYGKQSVTPMMLKEFEVLSYVFPKIEKSGFYISGFNILTDYIILPFILMFQHILPSSWLARLFLTGVRLSGPPFGVRLILDGKGESGNVKMLLEDPDGYRLTGCSIVAAIRQWLSGKIPFGVHLEAWAVDPVQFFGDLKEMGIKIEIQAEPKSVEPVLVN